MLVKINWTAAKEESKCPKIAYNKAVSSVFYGQDTCVSF